MISGKARGRRLRSVPGELTRPITDRSKEALFNIIGADIEGALFLDLFAGTGSVGIEALSQGAARAVFFDLQRQAIETIRANLKITGVEEFATIRKINSFSYLERQPDEHFDYVFIAPPQYKALWKRAVYSLEKNPGWLAEDAWVIVQIHPVEYEALDLITLAEFDQRRYGSVLFVFYQKRGEK